MATTTAWGARTATISCSAWLATTFLSVTTALNFMPALSAPAARYFDSGNDILDGGTGADQMWGGKGNDL